MRRLAFTGENLNDRYSFKRLGFAGVYFRGNIPRGLNPAASRGTNNNDLCELLEY